MVRDGVIEDYVIGGATALLYFSVPNFVTEDIDVFVHLKDKPSSSLIDVSPLYNYLISRKNAHIQGEYIVVDDFPLQFLTPYDELSSEAFANAMSVSPENIPFKIFKLEYSMAIMIQLGKEKYVERLRTLMKHSLYNKEKLESLLDRFDLKPKWLALARRPEGLQ